MMFFFLFLEMNAGVWCISRGDSNARLPERWMVKYGCGHGDREDDDKDDDGMAGVVELGAGCGDDGMVAVVKWRLL